MIKESTPLIMTEIIELVGDSKRSENAKTFIKRFSKMSADKAKELKENLKKLDLIKLKDEHIVKIADFMPEDATDLTKIIPDISLNQDEINKILDVVKKY